MRSRADRRRGALLAALMMAALPLGSLADEALPSPTAEAPAEPTAEPTDAPSAEPAPTPDASPALTPEASPAPEASESPAPTASDAPSPTPEPSASPAPTAYPLLEPGMSGDEVLMLQNRLVELGYLSYAEGLAPDGLYDEATAAAVAGFQTRLQLEPTGIADDALQQILYAPDAPAYSDPAASPQPSALPGFPPGGFPSGGFPSGGWGGIDMSGLAGMAGMQGMPGAEQQALPAVIPGQALTSSHSAGDKDMALYGALDAAALDGRDDLTALTGEDGEPVLSALAQDGAAQTFSAALDEATLTLSAGEGAVWQMNGYALRMLERGGVERLRLVTPEGECALATSSWLRGEEYGYLRAQGCVSQDFDVTIAPAGGAITVRAAGNEYAAEAEDGALTLCNAEQEPDA